MFRGIAYIIIIYILLFCKSNQEENQQKVDTIQLEVIIPDGSEKANIFLSNYNFDNPKANKLNTEGTLLIKRGKYVRAEEKFKEALSYEPDNPVILNNLGNYMDYMAYKKEALDYYSQAIVATDSSYFLPMYNLARVYCKMGKYQECEKMLNIVLYKFKEAEFQSVSNFLYSHIYIYQEKCEKAKIYYKRAKQFYDTIPELQSSLKNLELKIEQCQNKNIP